MTTRFPNRRRTLMKTTIITNSHTRQIMHTLIRHIRRTTRKTPTRRHRSGFHTILRHVLEIKIQKQRLILRNSRLITRGLTNSISLHIIRTKGTHMPSRTLIGRLLRHTSLILVDRFQIQTIQMRRIRHLRTRIHNQLLYITSRHFQAQVHRPPMLTTRDLRVLTFQLIFNGIQHLRNTTVTNFNYGRRFITQAIPTNRHITRRFFTMT